MRNLLALVMAWVAISWTVVARADLIIRPGPQGGLGTWLVAGPLFGTEKAMRFSGEQEIVLGATVMPGRDFRLLQAPDGQFDLQRELRAPSQALSLIHISEPTRLLSTSYAVFCLQKKKIKKNIKIICRRPLLCNHGAAL